MSQSYQADNLEHDALQDVKGARRARAVDEMKEEDVRALLCKLAQGSSGKDAESATPLPQAERLDGLRCLQEYAIMSNERHCITLHASDSIVMSALRRPFPPRPAMKSDGFSFFASVKLERRMIKGHNFPIIRLFDAEQRSCSVTLAVEAESGQITYSTGLRHGTLAFPKATLQVGRWHHVCLVHFHPAVDSHSSRVQLFFDGALAHQYDGVPWPSLPPPSSLVRSQIGGIDEAKGTRETTEDLGSRSEHDENVLRWSIGTAYMLDDVLPPDLPLVLSELAATGYNGNFQDSLGRFLTYSTSTKVNLRLDALSRSNAIGRDLSENALVQVVTGSASLLFPEERFYFVLNPANVDAESITRQVLTASALEKTEQSTEQTKGRSMARNVLLNQVAPMNLDAIENTYGYARLLGRPARRQKECLGELVYRFSGFALLLRLIEQSDDPATLRQSLVLFFTLVGASWRLSEEVESARGYELLNHILRQKIAFIDSHILDCCAAAVGLANRTNEDDCQEAALVNPFLFRILMLDFSIWSRTPIDVQIAHLEVLNTLLRTSKHRRFNARRVAKMHLTRKVLLMLNAIGDEDVKRSKGVSGGPNTTSRAGKTSAEQNAMLAVEYVTTLRASLVATFNDAAIRNITSFLATHLCTTPSALRALQVSEDHSTADVSSDAQVDTPDIQVSHSQLALMIFEMLAELVMERPAFLRKFGSVINARWLRIFVSLTKLPRASRVALDIMAALVSIDPQYAEQRSAATTERRMRLWYETICKAEEARATRARSDTLEAELFAARRWSTDLLPELLRERAIAGPRVGESDRVFELDPIEGPLRMRAKLREARSVWTGKEGRKEHKERTSNHLGDVSRSSELSAAHAQDGSATSAVDLSGALTVDEEEDDSNEVPGARNVTRAQEGDELASTEASMDLQSSDNNDSHDDKYRRIIRTLERGDVIEGVENSLRVVFIEYRASLLIFGKRCFYIIDDYFQRPDGELCNVWEAPEEERDTVVMSTLGNTNSRLRGGDGTAAMTLVQQIEGDHHQTRKWKWRDLRLVTMKTFLHRKTAVEVAFRDGQTCLLVLATTTQASAVFQTLSARNRAAAQAFQNLCNGVKFNGEDRGSGNASPSGQGPRQSAAGGSGGFARLADAVLGRRGIGPIMQRWIEGRISNFDYLMCLNIASGRTYQDITQYPVMPFVLRDYDNEELDLSNPETFRDLSLPMGAQTDDRRKQFQDRYEQLAELYTLEADETTKPFHYGTHYSTAATVSGYLIRLRPFDKIVKALQGGSFDLPDRIFSSIGHAYHSAAAGSLGDVRELIPEAFYLPDFLVNANKFDFGQTQNGVKVDNVQLPPWAKGDARLFVKLHRDALESDFVSGNLHHWIDLIFGFKQRGEAAIEATNCFHELSYEDGALDVQQIESPIERQAVLKTIHMFGVCPRQLFQSPHPAKQVVSFKPKSSNVSPLPSLSLSASSTSIPQSIARTPWLLTQSIAPLRVLKHSSVHFIYFGSSTGSTKDQVAKAFVTPKDYMVLPSENISLSLGHLDGSIRFYARDKMNTVRSVTEQLLPERASCFANATSDRPSLLGGQTDGADDGSGSLGGGTSGGSASGHGQAKILIGGTRGTLMACTVDIIKTGATTREQLAVSYACRGHLAAILSLDHSHAWSLTVSGSQDKTAIIWDDCGRYLKTLQHSAPVQCVAVCRQSNGYIATASGATLSVWSVNGDPIANVETGSSTETISAVAFYEGNGDGTSFDDDQRSSCMVFTGHRGKVIGWRCVPDYDRLEGRLESKDPHSRWRLEPFHVSEHFDRFETPQAGDSNGARLPTNAAHPPLVTGLRFCGETMLSGDENGRLYAWSLPGQAVEVNGAVASALTGGQSACMQCVRKFGVFEKRVHCASCGGVFCATCVYTLAGSPFGPFKYCIDCRDHLSMLVSKSPLRSSPSPSLSPRFR